MQIEESILERAMLFPLSFCSVVGVIFFIVGKTNFENLYEHSWILRKVVVYDKILSRIIFQQRWMS